MRGARPVVESYSLWRIARGQESNLLDKGAQLAANDAPSQTRAIMFGLLRLPILVLLAFLGGIFFERSQAVEACRAEGGTPRGGLCRGLS